MSLLPDFVEESDLTDYRAGDAATLIRQAQGAVRRYCGWHIAPSVTETVTLDGNGSRHLWLPSLYVMGIASVTNEGTALTTDDFDWSESGYIENRTGWFTWRPRQVVVTFTHGYDEIPDELISVVVSAATRRLSSPAGYVRETTGPFSVEYGKASGAFLADELAILDRFKLPPRP